MSSLWAAGSQFVLLLIAILLVVMPWTEHFWHFDNFLAGGQDFELTLLCVATILCFILVMLQHGKCSVQLSLSWSKWLYTIFRCKNRPAPGALRGLITALHVIAVPSASLGQYSLPLQV